MQSNLAAVAAATEPHVAEAATEALRRGNAVDAVVAGVLVAAAETPSVLLGPLQALVAGPGAGARALDGRVRQPGLGVPRPRGLLAGEWVPEQARVGVPALPGAIASLLASLGSATPLRLAGGAIARARDRSPERARVIEALATRGASVLVEDTFASELTAAAGRAARGLLTRDDIASVRPTLVSYDERSLGPAGLWTVPWRSVASRLDGSSTHVVAAVDARGMIAVACYETQVDGVPVPALGLVAPAFATPVLRGQPRVRPGEPCAAASPIALRVLLGIADLAMGIAQSPHADSAFNEIMQTVADGGPMELLGLSPAGRLVAIYRHDERAKVLASGQVALR